MSFDLDEIEPLESSDKARAPRSIPYVMLRTNGGSYLNQKAASLLGLEHEDLLRFFRHPNGSWFLGNDPGKGSTIRKTGGIYNFCDTRNIRKIFAALEITGTKAFFPLGAEVQYISAAKVPALFLTPKPFNIE